MSMISAQIDELRDRAKVLCQGRWSDGADDARLMEDAADTILVLREVVRRERAEADGLRTQLADVTVSMGRVEERCAKLRELVCHLYYVKPRDVTSILVNGEVLNFDELMAEVGLRWEDA